MGNGPFIAERAAQPLDLLESGMAGGGWEALEKVFAQAPETAGPLKPADDLAEFMWGLYCTAPGRAMFEWLMDVTVRQAFRVTGQSFEQTALNAACREGRDAVAMLMMQAVEAGKQSTENKRKKTEKPDA
ncbi:hypothetical protein [Martelella sp. FOR1707]